jgi:hypothetical protein
MDIRQSDYDRSTPRSIPIQSDMRAAYQSYLSCILFNDLKSTEVGERGGGCCTRDHAEVRALTSLGLGFALLATITRHGVGPNATANHYHGTTPMASPMAFSGVKSCFYPNVTLPEDGCLTL